MTIVFWKLGLQSLYYIESRYHHYGKLCVVALSRVSWALRLCPEFGRSDLNLKEMMCDQHRGLVLCQIDLEPRNVRFEQFLLQEKV